MAYALIPLGTQGGFQLAVIGGPYWPLPDAGADVASHTVSTQLSRTATEDNRGSTITAREWRITSGPAGVDTVIGTAAALAWTPTVSGLYTLRYTATNAVGSGSDDMNVSVSGGSNEIDVFMLAGQSNATYNAASTDPDIPAIAAGIAYRYDHVFPGEWIDPHGSGPMPAFINRYYTLTGRVLGIVHYGAGGTAQSSNCHSPNWDATGTLYNSSVGRLDNGIAGLTSLGYTPILRGIIWDQGGRDAQDIDLLECTKANYKAALQAMIARYRTEYGATLPFYIFRLGRPKSGDTPGWLDVRTAQDEVVAADPLTHFAYENQVNYPTLGMMADDFHYTQVGYNTEGTAGADIVVADLFGSTTIVSIDQSDPQSVEEAATLQLSATVTNPSGSTTWSSGTPAAATVNASTGLVTGVAVGSTIITATNNGVSDTITVNVTAAGTTTTVDIDQASPQAVQDGSTLQLTVTVTNGSGGTTWGTSNAAVATVSTTGLVTGVAPGSATITATNNGVSDGIVVNVTAIPSAATVFLEAYDGNGWVTIPVAFADGVDAAPIDVGDLGIAFDGSLLDSRRATKRRWTITTRPVTTTEKAAILIALRNGPLVQFDGAMLDETLTLCAVRERGVTPAATPPSARRWILRFEMLED